MQRAGQCAARFVLTHCQPLDRIWLLVGPGNNGGDALTAGMYLLQAGLKVHTIMPQVPSDSAMDARNALSAWLGHGQSTLPELPLKAHLAKREADPLCFDRDDASSDLVIDGLFGIGLNRDLTAPWQTIVDQINTSNARVLSLDIPSGLMADTGRCLGRPIKATWTLAFIAPSHALYDDKTAKWVGTWDVCTLDLNV